MSETRRYRRFATRHHVSCCEHCEGERSPLARYDRLRGWVCEHCDSSLDAMENERADLRRRIARELDSVGGIRPRDACLSLADRILGIMEPR